MKLTIVAATGGIGRQALEQAVAAGHDVTAVVRDPSKLSRGARAVAVDLAVADPAALEHELGDALAWLVSVANVTGVDLERAAARYADGCPRCHHTPCTCPPA